MKEKKCYKCKKWNESRKKLVEKLIDNGYQVLADGLDDNRVCHLMRLY